MRRWPPIVWLLVYVGSVFISMGANGRWDTRILGIALVVVAFGAALNWALGRGGRPRPRAATLAIVGVAVFYVVAAIAAGILAGGGYAIAALLAGVIPATAIALAVAGARQKTDERGGTLQDASGDSRDRHPGIGFDTRSPLGDTSEHSDALDEEGSEVRR
jgi:peptidoglycan/LPS O-acetylase OafA/YrhL